MVNSITALRQVTYITIRISRGRASWSFRATAWWYTARGRRSSITATATATICWTFTPWTFPRGSTPLGRSAPLWGRTLSRTRTASYRWATITNIKERVKHNYNKEWGKNNCKNYISTNEDLSTDLLRLLLWCSSS